MARNRARLWRGDPDPIQNPVAGSALHPIRWMAGAGDEPRGTAGREESQASVARAVGGDSRRVARLLLDAG